VEERVITTDLYEGAYYLCRGAQLANVAGKKWNGKIACELTFSSPQMAELQISFFKGEALVNLLTFRRMFGQVHALTYKEKRRCQNILKNGGSL